MFCSQTPSLGRKLSGHESDRQNKCETYYTKKDNQLIYKTIFLIMLNQKYALTKNNLERL